MRTLPQIFELNKKWAENIKKEDPDFFIRLSKQQAPRYLWIGCSDSRVPATQICGLDPGEIFVHRNIANLVLENDLNALSTIQFAVDVLKVKDIIVCGHYGCGGVQAALQNLTLGEADAWISHIKEDLKNENDLTENRASEINVINQVNRLSRLEIIKRAWEHGQDLTLHGWIYSIENGLLKDLGVTLSN